MSLPSIEAQVLNTKLNRVEERSRQDEKMVFNNLGHLINMCMLRQCFESLDGSKAQGIDGITKEEYGKNLENNLKQLLTEIRKGIYYPKACRIVEIPKVDGSMRPLAIACFEDKIVQEAVRRVLERIYEPLFLDCSHGFRPRRGCHTALVALDRHLRSKDCRAILEIDLRQYFNTIPHEPLVRMLKHKISDQRFMHLVIKLLKTPIQSADGKQIRNEIGSPQGSILSPLISNLYLHYVLDIWFTQLKDKQLGTGGHVVRYADDAVFVFANMSDARVFQKYLVERLGKFGISINKAKTQVLECGQREAERHEHLGVVMPCFTFLGFLHVWGASVNKKSGKRYFRVKRFTCPIRYRKKLRQIKDYISGHRHDKALILCVKRAVQGYLNYFAVNDNEKRIRSFVDEVRKMLFKYLNRRSQRRSFDWSQFTELLRKLEFPKARILHHLFF